MILAFHASDSGWNPSLATIFYFYFLLFFAFVVFILIFFFLSFLSLTASTIRQLLHLGIKSQKAVNILYCLQKFSLFLSSHSPSCKQVRVMIPLTPHFYIVKLGFTGVHVYIFFLFLLNNIDRGYSLGSNVYQRSMF